MMAAFRNPFETSHCPNYQQHLQRLVPLLRSAVAVFSRFSACGSAWLWLSEMPLPPESFERLAKLPRSFRTLGCLLVCGSLADFTRFSVPLRWPNSAQRFPAAAANTISLVALSAITLDSSSDGATGFPRVALPPSPLSSPSTAAMKTAALMILVVTCFILGAHARAAAPAATTTLPPVPAGWPLVVALVLGLQAVVYTVDGWDGVIYFGEEVRNPGRDIPRAIFGSVFSVMGIYLLLNLVALYVLPMNEIAGNNFVLGAVADRVFGRFGDPTIRSIMIISMLSNINSNLLFSSRTLHAMSCDGLFFRRVARVNAGGTPALSLLLSTVVSLLFVLGSFERVIAMLSFFFVANYTLTYASLCVLRVREPQMDGAYRAWGYPWTTGIALGASVLFLIASIATDRENAPLALAMLILSYPVFRVLKWVTQRADTRASQNS